MPDRRGTRPAAEIRRRGDRLRARIRVTATLVVFLVVAAVAAVAAFVVRR